MRKRATYHFAWPNPAANPVRLLHTTVFLVGFPVPLVLAALGIISPLLALCVDPVWVALGIGAGFLIDLPYALGASADITPTGLVVKRYFLLKKTCAWRNVKSLRLQEQEPRPWDPILRHALFNQPHSDIPAVAITVLGTSSGEEETVGVFLQNPDAFVREAEQYVNGRAPQPEGD